MNESEKKYQEYLEDFSNGNTIKQIQKNALDEEIEKYEEPNNMEINYSFKEFYHYAQKNSSGRKTTPLRNVVYAVLSKNPDFSSHESLITIVSFLLCFACEEVCFWVFDSLLNEFFSNEIFAEDSEFFEQEIGVVFNLGKVFKIFNEEEEKCVQEFLKNYIKKCFRTCFLNLFNFQTLYFIWDNMFSKGSLMELEKVFLAAIKINLKHLQNVQNFSKKEIEPIIMNSTNFNEFRKEFSFELSNELRHKYGGFSFKKKLVSDHVFSKQMTFFEEPSQEKINRVFLKKAASGEIISEKNECSNKNKDFLLKTLLENHEAAIIELKREKDKLNKKLEEKDLLINKLMNENSSNNRQDIFTLIDAHLETLKKEYQNCNENSKISLSPKSHTTFLQKLSNYKAKFKNSLKLLSDLSNSIESPVRSHRSEDICTNKEHMDLLNGLQKEQNEFKQFSSKNEELNETITKIKNEASDIISKYENDCKMLKLAHEKAEKINKKLKRELEEVEKDRNSKIQEINNLTVENEAFANEVSRLIQEKSFILENQNLNEEKYEKIIRAFEEENQISKEKCATLHKNYNLIHDHSADKIHKCEKTIELKIAEIHHLNDQVNLLSHKMQEEKTKKLSISEEKEAILEIKNQEILNLKIDLNKLESTIQNQVEEMNKLERTHSIKMESFDVVLEEKENEISQLRRGLNELEDQLLEERRKVQSILESSSPITSPLEENQREEKIEKEGDRIRNLEGENEKLRKDLRLIKKSLKETLDLNEVFTKDLQKMKHRFAMELREKDQEIFKYRQMLERLDKIESANKTSPKERKNTPAAVRSFSKDQETNGVFFDYKSVFSDQKENNLKMQEIEVKQFPEDANLPKEQEVCKGCNIF